MTEIRIPAPCDFISSNKRYHHMAKANLVKQWQFSTCRSDSVLKLEQPPEALKHHPEA
ncbi:hypothetical protein MOMMJLID_CDS0060 [Arthrobacter phage 1191A]|nr:hypothetical protein MOMMJLID_CDS0060 [Arthrobacter phage 1191A]